MGSEQAHFGGKEAIAHVAERQARGILEGAEVHGCEVPGHLSAATDAAKESSVVIATVWMLFLQLNISTTLSLELLFIFAAAWLVWKSGRSAWLGWSRLERLHRVLAQEKWEIEHHRSQEREELLVLYRAKGFEGKLLDDVVDTLMADGDRLLKVMIEEEMGLSLETQEHPIKQAFGAFLGTLLSIVISASTFFLHSTFGIPLGSLTVIAVAAGLSAYYEKNRIVPALFWNMGIALLAFATVYYLTHYFFP